MSKNKTIDSFIGSYDGRIQSQILELRTVILKTVPGIKEELDLPARIIGCGFGPKYSDMICTIIPSKKGLKLGFYKGTELPDPKGLLQGPGKVHKYVVIESEGDIHSSALKSLLKEAYKAYRKRVG